MALQEERNAAGWIALIIMNTSQACKINPRLGTFMQKYFSKINVYGRMIKFEHTIFALPFALSALLLANKEKPVTLRLAFWIVMAVVWARSAGMGFNRLVDAYWDAKNPRTAMREIPAGNLSRRETALFVLISALLFILCASFISILCSWLSLPVLLVIFSYSYAKRFTWLSHFVLGIVQALGPLAVWIAATGHISLKISFLSLALGTYITGLDLLYSCQDVEFDRCEGLHSLPAKFGIRNALNISSWLHAVTFASLISLYWFFALSPYYVFFVALIGMLLVIEHVIVKPHDLSKVNIAFFHVNSIISILLLLALLTEELLQRFHLT